MMPWPPLTDDLEPLRRLCEQAGQAILAVRRRGFDIEAKADASPVTEADRLAHAILAEGLASLSGLPLLSEEGREVPWVERRALVAAIPEAQLLRCGSSVKFCRIAEGSADLYPRFAPTCEWDTAAGQAVLEAAGGAVFAVPALEPLRCQQGESLINGHFIACAEPGWRTRLAVLCAQGLGEGGRRR